MDLSIIVVAHNMQREIPRCLASLSPIYQQQVRDLSYEVLLIDNGSEPAVDDTVSTGIEVPLQLVQVPDPSPSPAAAINLGLARARGDVVCLMIDGAHVLTPGVLRWTIAAFRSFSNPVVATRYFYLGPGDQPDTVARGYSQVLEDSLFEQIAWPSDGYRLFEIGAALRGPSPSVSWLNRMFESNCISVRRELALDLGGMDEQFDLAGGGFVNLDFFKRACDRSDTQLVELIGEGSFHQLHGGTTTNSDPGLREERLERFREQYRLLRGSDEVTTHAPIHYLGHLPSEDAKIHRRPCGRVAAQVLKPTD